MGLPVLVTVSGLVRSVWSDPQLGQTTTDDGDARPGTRETKVSYHPLCTTLTDGSSTVTDDDDDDGTGISRGPARGPSRAPEVSMPPPSVHRDS